MIQKTKKIGKMTLLGVGLCIVFWLLETTIHTYIFHEDKFVRELFPSYDPNELWMRFVVCAILIIFGFHADLEINRRRRAEEELKKSEEELQFLSSQLFTIQEEERAHLASHLHDSVGQSLVAIKYGMEMFLLKMKEHSGDVKTDHIQELIYNTQTTIGEFRKIYMDLRPSILDELGILDTINWYIREIQEIYPELCIEQYVDIAETDIPSFLKIHVYRILQEALDNIVYHSRASKVLISFIREKDSMELTIKDNGMGFDVEAFLSVEKSKRGFGIGSLKERGRITGGLFTISSIEGKGTELEFSWPIEQFSSN